MLTQSNAFDSRAQTRGHSSGVIVLASVPRISSFLTSLSIDQSLLLTRLLLTGSVVEVQDSQDVVRDLYWPDWITVCSTQAAKSVATNVR